MDYIVFYFVHWKVEHISKVNWWEHIIGCMQLRQREPYIIASYHNISNDLNAWIYIMKYILVMETFYVNLCWQSIHVASSIHISSHIVLRFTTCEIAKEITQEMLWNNQNCIFIEKKIQRERRHRSYS